jgi:hypothetical protein
MPKPWESVPVQLWLMHLPPPMMGMTIYGALNAWEQCFRMGRRMPIILNPRKIKLNALKGGNQLWNQKRQMRN